MAALIVAIRLIILFLGVACSNKLTNALHIIVQHPITWITTEGYEVALISIPGAFIAGEDYGPLCEDIQAATPMKLWVGLAAGFPMNFPSLVDVGMAIDLAIRDLQNAGMSGDAPIFVAGHSMGGRYVTNRRHDALLSLKIQLQIYCRYFKSMVSSLLKKIKWPHFQVKKIFTDYNKRINTLGIISTKWKELIYSITSLSQPSEKQRFTQLLPHGLSQQLR